MLNSTIFTRFSDEMEERFSASTDLNGNSLLERMHTIRRMPYGKSRRYFTKVGSEPRLMSGLTTITKIIEKQKGFYSALGDWRATVGIDEADQIAQETSVLGTFIHILCAEIAYVRQANDPTIYINLNEEFKNEFKKMMLENGVRHRLLDDYYKRALKAAQSFDNWLNEWDVSLVAIEWCVMDLDNNVCTPLDIIAYATEPLSAAAKKRGEVSNRFLGNFNIKFREKADSVYTTDMLQTCIEMQMYNKYMVNSAPIERTFTLTPKSHYLSKIGCAVHEHTGKYTEDEYAADMAYMKSQSAHSDIFNPDMGTSLVISDMRITRSGVERQAAGSVEDYINSFFE
jgi:hypothetical protein